MNNLNIVGEITKEISDIIDFKKGNVFISNGAIKHIKRKHSHELSEKVLKNLIKTIEEIIKNPDLVGKHPKKKDSIEFVKRIDDNILLAIKTDKVNNYLYVSTLFPIKESKIKSRLHSGRLKKI
jgi:hypothetical protein